MPGNKTLSPHQKRRRRALRRGSTRSQAEFAYLCRHAPHRVGIVAEGDSWFSYPRQYLLAGPDINLLHHLQQVLEYTDTANLIECANNGDEAVEMLAGRQKYRLAKLLQKNAKHIDLIYFSGGGNDVVGDYDMDRLLKDYQQGFSAKQCLRWQHLQRKMDRIELAYQELLEIRNEYAPEAVVITHTYDIAQPSEKGAELLKFYKTGPWILPHLKARGIPQSLHTEIVQCLLGELRSRLVKLASAELARGRFEVIDTQGTLRPGHGSDWLNEIHPTASGFRRLHQLIYTRMKQLQPKLP